MILKASQRGGGKQLALHLLRTDENEHVEIHEMRGFVSDNLIEALKEAHAISKATKCKQFLFSVSLNPPPTERVEIATFEEAVKRIEEANGLSGQPRAIVFHEKEGRRHAHAVWSRIDAETMTAKNLAFFKTKLRDISRDIYFEQGWKMPRGLMNSRESDPRNFTLAEWHQAKRTGMDARDLKSMMQECWAASDSHAAFSQALRARGFTLAKGDRRAHVALSPEGEVYSVARMVGKKTKDVRNRLGDPSMLPDITEAKAALARDLSATFKRHIQEVQALKRRELSPLEIKRQAMALHHRQERVDLRTNQKARWVRETRCRSERFDRGIRGLWSVITGKNAEIRKRNEREAYAALTRDRLQRQALIDAQMRDRQVLQEKIESARFRHAELLQTLRDQKHKVRELGSPQKHIVATPSRKTNEDRLREARSSSAGSKNRSDPKDRLKTLRGEWGGQAPNSNRDHER